ncbi:MAG: TlyA family RNA methyltransferase [Oscillospiraceae bacterium]|jgi:23S rRNA (cytidine1920-2'-O)/16S rRNA (cytidine1409-2'-O)-methyltransferase|nr:TlyA family RNA methyltransferase [Oscillospiraceae bacterium]
MQNKSRLDLELVKRGLAASREQSQALITTGLVSLNGEKAEKASVEVSESDNIEIRGKGLKYVSRGGLKLEKAVESFAISLEGAVCADIGASTGGFTDCMLQNGAAKVYCVDVGYGQLAWKLRGDARVVNMERSNIRYIDEKKIEPLDFISIDVSFISLELVLPVAYRLLKDGGGLVCLIKPQFEAGKGRVGKKGVVREPEIHAEVVRKICLFAVGLGFALVGLDFSPIKGPEGNIEYLLYISKRGGGDFDREGLEEKIEALVRLSHEAL